MTGTEIEKWVAYNGATDHQSLHYNGIDYATYKLPDGWVAIFEYENGEYWPKIQAADFAHAKSWCAMRERLNVQVTQI